MELFIGLMSGTSVDGIDAVLVDFSKTPLQILGTYYSPYTQSLRDKILAICHPGDNEIMRMGELDVLLGKEFAQAVNYLIKENALSSNSIRAIGSHGQNIRHHPHKPHPFTIQIGDPNIIAAETGITTVADFRRKDIALSGQGAPLVPAFHQQIFSSTAIDRAVVNIGGIANITILEKENSRPVIGYDTGPGNALLDAWIYSHKNQLHDKHGEWAAKGTSSEEFLQHMLADPYFSLTPPKSTGREYFNLIWLQKYLSRAQTQLAPIDVQCTLVELTARSIINAVQKHFASGEILVCGGGVHNSYLMSRLSELAKPHFRVTSTKTYGVDPDWVEAIAFAWLAKQALNCKPGNLPSVTGAKKAAVLGGVYHGS